MDAAASTHERPVLAAWWRGRYGGRLVAELSICTSLLLLYRGIRGLNKDDLQAAFANTRNIISFEKWVGLPFEDDIQRWLLDHPTLIKLLNHYYIWFHFPAAIGLLLWLFVRHPSRYASFRNLMTFATFSALAIHLVFPLAPPRMISGFVDTMRVFGPSIYPASALEGAANQIAAMPSLHFGWALIEAVAVVSVLTSRWRWIVVLHPLVMTLAIIATANHWWVDAAAAGALVGVASWIGRRVGRGPVSASQSGTATAEVTVPVRDGDLVDAI